MILACYYISYKSSMCLNVDTAAYVEHKQIKRAQRPAATAVVDLAGDSFHALQADSYIY
jgi:hypothetical protein